MFYNLAYCIVGGKKLKTNFFVLKNKHMFPFSSV